MRRTMPARGTNWSELEAQMTARAAGDVKWRDGKTAVYVFNAGEDVEHVQKSAYLMFMSENGLGPRAFPSLKSMEDDVIDMALGLLHAPDDAAGTMTSGGTDSITMAIKAARDFALAERTVAADGGAPNIVAPFSAHPAFDKAAHLMGLEVRRIAVTDSYLADVRAMAAAIDDNTMMLVGSAPSFPYGLIDDIEALGQLARERDVWLHVDACVGGYLAPFVRMNGGVIRPFDFEVAGVSSMSADLHKYGYAAKGASSVLYRSESLHDYMVFDCSDWPGGRMVTPTLAGTRPGGAISSAWAVMNFLGIEGYRAKQKLVTDAREVIEQGVKELGFEVLGAPQLGIMAFRHPIADSGALHARLTENGWITSATSRPRALHLMLSPFHRQVADVYLADLREALDTVLATGEARREQERYN